MGYRVMGLAEMMPRLIFWEITQDCNLQCPYCRRDNISAGLSLRKSRYIIDSIVENYRPLLIFSGGEPLLYPYFFEVASYARKRGLKLALATNATLIDKNLAKKIKSIDFHRVAVSLDGPGQDINDALRGAGSFLRTMTGIQYLQSQNIELQINTTIFRRNFKEVPAIYELCLELGIKALHIFAFVPVGCGIAVSKEERLSPEEYEEFLKKMAQLSLASRVEIKLTCAPHYQRILSERQSSCAEKRERTKGCLAGSAVCFISGTGEVYPCGYLKLSAGNVLKSNFKKIWEDSFLFQTLRRPNQLKGKCGVCEYRNLCGGCRARAYAKTGNFLAEEPECVYQPSLYHASLSKLA